MLIRCESLERVAAPLPNAGSVCEGSTGEINRISSPLLFSPCKLQLILYIEGYGRPASQRAGLRVHDGVCCPRWCFPCFKTEFPGCSRIHRTGGRCGPPTGIRYPASDVARLPLISTTSPRPATAIGWPDGVRRRPRCLRLPQRNGRWVAWCDPEQPRAGRGCLAVTDRGVFGSDDRPCAHEDQAHRVRHQGEPNVRHDVRSLPRRRRRHRGDDL